MLTIKKLQVLQPGEVFAVGCSWDQEDELFMNGTGKMLKWVATRGGAPDWTMYCFYDDRSIDWIKAHGDKVLIETHIRERVLCDDEAFARYRY